jgi:glycosyltransferase involved in cell wall biosynthesis
VTLHRKDFVNLEGLSEFKVEWHEADRSLGMFTAVLRVKNEAQSLPYVLPGLLRVADALILVDNGSDDGTPEVATRVAEEQGAADDFQVLEYPFQVSRCGSEHLATPPNSVHSLTYFYNWAFSHVRTRYVWKWDGDMVLTEEGEKSFNELRWQLEGFDAIVQVPRYPVYIESEDVAYVDADMINREAWAWPNRAETFFVKSFEWELPLWPPGLPFVRLPEWTCFELKWLDADEFQHWSPTADFSGTSRTSRKRREWEVFHAVQEGKLPFGVHRVESPGAKHVIDLLREPSAARFVLEH